MSESALVYTPRARLDLVAAALRVSSRNSFVTRWHNLRHRAADFNWNASPGGWHATGLRRRCGVHRHRDNSARCSRGVEESGGYAAGRAAPSFGRLRLCDVCHGRAHGAAVGVGTLPFDAERDRGVWRHLRAGVRGRAVWPDRRTTTDRGYGGDPG